MIKAVFFDLDHTLYDRAATFAKLAPEFLRHFACCFTGIAPPAEKIADMLARADRDQYANWPKAYGQLSESLQWTPPGYGPYEAFLHETMGKCAEPWPDTQTVLRRCRDMRLKIGMITNGRSALQNEKIDTLGIRKYFDVIVISGEFGAAKPDPSIFLHAASLVGLPPEDIAFVGDNPVNDALASAAVGMTPVWLGNFRPWPEALEPPEYVAIEFGDVVKILDRLRQ